MITSTEIYWILKLDDIQHMFIAFYIVTAMFCLASAVAWGIYADSWSDDSTKISQNCRKRFFMTVPVVAILVAIATFIPSTKQMAMIKVIPAIANSEIVSEMSADAKELYKMGIKAIKEQLTGKGNNVPANDTDNNVGSMKND